jgi:hypothetical protein
LIRCWSRDAPTNSKWNHRALNLWETSCNVYKSAVGLYSVGHPSDTNSNADLSSKVHDSPTRIWLWLSFFIRV